MKFRSREAMMVKHTLERFFDLSDRARFRKLHESLSLSGRENITSMERVKTASIDIVCRSQRLTTLERWGGSEDNLLSNRIQSLFVTSFQDTKWIFYIVGGISERTGCIESITKLEKIIYFCSGRMKDSVEVLKSLDFERGYFGPRDAGASYDLETNFLLGIYEDTSEGAKISFRLTSFGRKFIRGLKALLALDSAYEYAEEEIDQELEDASQKPLSEILRDKRIVKAKEKFMKEKVQ